MAKDDAKTNDKTPAAKGKYTVLEAQTITLTVPGVDGAADTSTDVQAFVRKGEVEARSKNDAIRNAFNEGLIEGAGEYAAVTSRSFAPVKVEPKTRTALSWG